MNGLSYEEFNEKYKEKNGGNTTLDPNTNLPKNAVQKNGVDYDDFLIKYRYHRKRDGISATLPLGFEGPNPEEFDFQLRNFADNEEIRAVNQPTTEIIRNGLVNLVGKTGLKILEGAGYVGSSIRALANGDINYMLDNAFSTTMSNLETDLSKAFPVYKTKKYLQGDVWEQMGTAGFWFDDVVDGMAFMLSAWASGGIYNALTKGVGNYAKLAKAYNTAMKASKLGKAVPWVGKGLNVSKVANGLDFLTLSAYNVASEAAFESKDLRDQYMQANDPLIKSGEKDFDQVWGEARAAAFNTFKWNTVALAPSNMLELSYMFKRFNPLKTGTRSFINPITKELAEAPKNTFGNLAAAFLSESALTALAEGPYEENIQYAIQKFNQDRATNFNFNEPIGNQIKQVMLNMVDNFRDDEGLKNIVLGSLIGWLPGGVGGVRSKIEETKLERGIHDKVATEMAAAKGLIHKYLKSEPILDNDGKPTGEYRVTLDKDGGTILDEKALTLAVLGEIGRYNSFASIMKALGTGNELVANYGVFKDLAARTFRLAASGVSLEDAKTMLDFDYQADLETMSKENPMFDERDTKKAYEEYKKSIEDYYKIFNSINNSHGGLFDFGSTKDDLLHKEKVMSAQLGESVFQHYWQDKQDKVKEELNKLDGDTVVELLENLNKELTDEEYNVTSYSRVLDNVRSLEKDISKLQGEVNTKTGEAKEKAQEKLIEAENELAKENERLAKIEKRYATRFRKSTYRTSLDDQLDNVLQEISDIQEALASPGVEPIVKVDLQRKLEYKKKEKAKLESRQEALELSTPELRDIISKGPNEKYDKQDIRAFKNELTYRETASTYIDNNSSASTTSQAKIVDLVNKYFEIEDMLQESKDKLTDLLDEDKQKKLWEEEKAAIEKSKKDAEHNPGPTTRENMDLEKGGATVISTDGKPTFIRNFTPEAAERNGYEIHEKKSIEAARKRGENIIDGKAKPSVYVKKDKKNKHTHYIYTDGSEAGNIIREVDYIDREIKQDKFKNTKDKVTYWFENDKLKGIKYTKSDKNETWTLDTLPLKNNGDSYTKSDFPELYSKLKTYLPGYSPTESDSGLVIPSIEAQEKADTIEKIRQSQVTALIGEHWASSEYDSTTPKKVFVDNNDTAEFQAFYNGLLGVVGREGDFLVFTPFKEKDGQIIRDEENKKIISSIENEYTFKQLGIKATLDSFVDVQFSEDGKTITIEGTEFKNEFYNPTDAVEEKNGYPVAVKLHGPDGKIHTFTDPEIVEAVAYGIMLTEVVYDQIFDDLFATGEAPVIVNYNGTDYLVYRKDGEYIVKYKNKPNKKIGKNAPIYGTLTDLLKGLVSEQVDRLISERLYKYRNQLEKQRDEVRRINKILRSPNPEEAYNAPLKGEIQTAEGPKRSATSVATEDINEDQIRVQIAVLREEISQKERMMGHLRSQKKEANEDIRKNQANIQKVDDEIKKASAHIEELKHEAEQLERQLTDEINKVNEQDVGIKLQQINNEILRVSGELAALDAKIAEAADRYDQVQSEINRIVKSKRRKVKGQRKMAAIKALEDRKRIITNSIKKLRSQRLEILDAIEQLQSDARELQSLLNKPEEVRQQLENKNNEIALARQVLAELQSPTLLQEKDKQEVEVLNTIIRELEKDINDLRRRVKEVRLELASYEEKLKAKINARKTKVTKKQEAKEKAQREKDKKEEITVKIEGSEVEPLGKDEAPDEGYLEIVVVNNGIKHSATALSYVSFIDGKYQSRSVALEKHAIRNGVDGDTLIPYIKTDGESEQDQKFIDRWWKNNKLEDVREKIRKGESLSEEETKRLTQATDKNSFTSIVDQIPIGLKYRTKDGKVIPGEFSYHASNFPIKIPYRIKKLEKENYNKYLSEVAEYTAERFSETRKARQFLLNGLLKGEEIKLNVDGVAKGRPNNVGTNQSLATLIHSIDPEFDLKNTSIGIAKGKGIIYFNDVEVSAFMGNPGNVFWRTNYTANGKEGIIKLNPAKLSREHAALVLKLLQDISRKGQGGPKQEYSNPEKGEFPVPIAHVEGVLTRQEILNLLVHQGKKYTKIDPKDESQKHLLNKQLYTDTVGERKVLVFGQNTMDLYSKDEKDIETFLEWAATNKNYAINWKMFGGRLKTGSFKIGDFVYDENEDNYISSILKSGFILTDVDRYEGTKSVYKNPAITIDVSASGIDFTLTPEEEAFTKIPKKKVVTKKDPEKPKSTTSRKSSNEVKNTTTKETIKKTVENKTAPKNKESFGTSVKGFAQKLSTLPIGSQIYYKWEDDGETGYWPIAEIKDVKGKRTIVFSSTAGVDFSAKFAIDSFRGAKIDINSPVSKITDDINKAKLYLLSANLVYDSPGGTVTTTEAPTTEEAPYNVTFTNEEEEPYIPPTIQPIPEGTKPAEKGSRLTAAEAKRRRQEEAAKKEAEQYTEISPEQGGEELPFMGNIPTEEPPAKEDPEDTKQGDGTTSVDPDDIINFGFRLADEIEHQYEKGNFEEAKQWLEARLPKEISIRLHNGLIKAYGNKRAFGKVVKMGIVLSDMMAQGTEYHEAFHVVSLFYLTPNERQDLYGAAKQKYKELKDSTDREINEFLAERFREFVVEKQSGKRLGIIKRLGRKIARLFKIIWDTMRSLLFNENGTRKKEYSIDQLFEAINKGAYKSSTVSEESIREYEELYGGDESFFRLFEINGATLKQVGSEEEFQETVQTLFYLLLQSNNILTTTSEGAVTLGISNLDDINEITYPNLFKALEGAVQKGISIAGNLESLQTMLNNNPGNKTVIDAVKKTLKTTVSEDKLHTLIENRILEANKKVNLFNEILENKEVYIDHLERFMHDLNIKTNRAQLGELIEEGDTYENTVEDLSQMHTWNEVAFKFSAKDNTATLIKLILSILPESNEKSTVTGFPKFVPFGVMWERAMSDFDGLIRTSDIMDKLSVLSEGSLPYSVLNRYLRDNELVKTQFIRTIRKYKLDFVNALVTLGKGAKIDFVGAAVQTLAKRYLDEWAQTFTLNSPLFKNVEGKGLVPDKKYFKKVMDQYEDLSRRISFEYRNEGTLPSLQLFMEETSELLGETGITIGEKELSAVLREIDKNPSVALFKLVVGTKDFKGISYLYDSKDSTMAKMFRGEYEKDNKGRYKSYETAFRNESGMRWLAEAIAKNNPTELGYSIFGPAGNRYYTIMQNTFITDMLNIYKDVANGEEEDGNQILEEKLGGVYNTSSDILNNLYLDPEFRDKLHLKTLSAFVVLDKGDEGREYQTITDIEEYLLRLNSIADGHLMIPTPADRKFIFFLEGLDKLETYYSQDKRIPTRIVQKFMDYAGDEHDRVLLTTNQVDDAIAGNFRYDDLIENIHYTAAVRGQKITPSEVVLVRGTDGKAVVASKKNGYLTSKGVLTTTGKIVKDSQGYVGRGTQYTHFKSYSQSSLYGNIESYLEERLQEEIEKAIDLQIIEGYKNEVGIYEITSNNLIDDDLIKHYKEQANLVSDELAIENILLDNMINTMYVSLEMEKAFFGDPATFKNAEDMMKRIPQYTSTGDNLRNDFPTEFDEDPLVSSGHYNVSVSDDVIFKSEYYNNLVEDFTNLYLAAGVYENEEDARKQAETKLAPFKKVNETDGQTFILPEMYRALSIKLGEWSEGKQRAYEALTSDEELTLEDKLAYANLLVAPLKMQYLRVGTRNGQSYPIIDKMSLATLFPAMIRGTKLEKLYDRMSAQGEYEGMKKIHQVKFKSAQKTGVGSVWNLYADEERGDISDLTDIPIEVQDFDFLRHQLNTTPHDQRNYLIGTQVKKVGIADVDMLGTYSSGRDGYTIVNEIHSILNEISDYGKAEFMNDLGISNNYEIIDKGSFIDKLKQEAIEANMPDYIVNALQLDEDGNFYLQLDALPGNRKWVQARIISLIKRAVADLRMPGGVFVQMTSAGLESVSFDDRLKVYNEDGLMEARVSVSMFSDVIPNYKNLTHSERVEWLRSHPDVTALTYRIPTQGQNSEYAVVIKEFIPEEAGKIIVLPAEGTTIGGYDFDIDKLYMMRHHYNRHGEKIKYLTEENSTVEERYIRWINENVPTDIKTVVRSVLKEEAEAIREKYAEEIEEIKATINRQKETWNLNLKDELGNEFKELSDEFKKTEIGKQLDETFKLGKLIFRMLPNNVKKSFYEQRDILDEREIKGARRILEFKSLAEVMTYEQGLDEGVKHVLYQMIDLYNKQLNLYGYKDDYLADRKKAVREEFNKIKGERNERFYAEKVSAIEEKVGERNSEFYKFRLREAEEMAEMYNLPTLEMFSKISGMMRQNTKRALQNRLLDNYMEIYLDEKHALYRYQPLEYGTKQMSKMAQYIAEREGITADLETKPLATLTPRYQLEVKSKYKLGGNLGIYALANVHHAMGQFVELGLFDYIGIGNKIVYKGKEVTDLSQRYGQEETNMEGVKVKMPITEIFSSVMNGHVDLATDPYIIYLNMVKETSDVISLLLRAGVGMTTFWYTAQPALKELTKKVENKSNKLNVYIASPLQDLIDKYREKVSQDFNFEEEVDNIYNNMQSIFNEEVLKNDIGRNPEQQNEAYFERQLRVLLAYRALKPYSESLRDAVLSSRDDTKKFGSSYSQLLVYNLRKQKVLDTETMSLTTFKQAGMDHSSYGIRNFGSMMKDTFLHNISKNAQELSKGTLQQLMLEATDSFEEAIIEILSSVGMKYTADSKFVDSVATELYTEINSEYFKEYVTLSEKDFKELLFSNNSIPKKIYKIKTGQYLPELQNNRLIKALLPVFAKEDSGLPDTTVFMKPDSKWSKDVLNRAWLSMYNSENDDVANFATDLFYYSYLTSGFRNGLYTFFDLVPNTILKDMGYDLFIKEKLKEYRYNRGLLLDKTDAVFMNGWRSDDLVPELKFSYNQDKGVNYISKDSTILTTKDQNLVRGFNKDLEFVYTPYVKVLIKNAKEGNRTILYKYAGYLRGTGEAVYYAVDKKGYYNKGQIVKENILNETVFKKQNSLPYLKDKDRKLLNDENIGTKVNLVTNSLKQEAKTSKHPYIQEYVRAFQSGFIQVLDRHIETFKEIDPYAADMIVEYVELDDNLESDPVKNVPEGETKKSTEPTESMVKVANAFIGEVTSTGDPNKAVDLDTGSEVIGALNEVQNKIDQGSVPHIVYQGKQKGGNRHTVFSSKVERGSDITVMLKRESGRAGYPLNDATKANIKLAHEAGAKFVVGDDPKLDNRFIQYLNELGAEYTVYYDGTNRLSKITRKPIKNSTTKKTTTKTTTKKVNVYHGGNENAELSNFAERPFTMKGVEYRSVEEYYQIAKVDFLDIAKYSYKDAEYNEIVENNNKVVAEIQKEAAKEKYNPYNIRKLGTRDGLNGVKYKGIDWTLWEQHKGEIMFNAMLESFKANPAEAKALINTGDALITHMKKGRKIDDMKDTFATTLMKVRDILQENEDETYKDNCAL